MFYHMTNTRSREKMGADWQEGIQPLSWHYKCKEWRLWSEREPRCLVVIVYLDPQQIFIYGCYSWLYGVH